MPATRTLASLHPATVARSEELAAQGRRDRRRKPTRGPRAVRSQHVYTTDPRVMAEALRLAGGDVSRLVLVPEEGAVIVANHSRRQ